MAAQYENLSSTAKAVTESRVDRTADNGPLDGIPNVSPAARAGLHGLTALANGQTSSGPFCKLVMQAATTFSVLEGHNLSGTLTSLSYPANYVLEGYFTRLTVSAGGSVICYKA